MAEDYTGDVRQIIRHRPDEGEGETYHRTRFNFDGAGRVWMVMSDTYEWDGDPENAPTDHEKLSAREFRYHTDQVGTTRAMTSALQGSPGERSVTRRAIYTAFGERINPPLMPSPGGSRYGYCGAWGYESGGGGTNDGQLWGDDLAHDPGLVHVGARWYEPATGRFIQRDPIGIRGGTNTYQYAGANPVSLIDPAGEITIGVGIGGSVQGPGASASANVGIHIGHDPSQPWYRGWSGDILISGGAGLGAGASVGAGFTLAKTNASSVGCLSGWGWQAGGSIGPGGANVMGGTGYGGAEVQYGPIGGGAGAYAETTYTFGVIDSIQAVHRRVTDAVGEAIFRVLY